MYKFINRDRLETKNTKRKTELDKLILEAGLGYTDLFLDNLKALSEVGFDEAQVLLDKLVELNGRMCEMKPGIADIKEFEMEMYRTYSIGFGLYGYVAVCKYIVGNKELDINDDIEALKMMHYIYIENNELFKNKLNYLVDHESELSNYTSVKRYNTKVEDASIKLNMETVGNIINF